MPSLRPVVLLPECLAPRLIRNLLDLPSSRLDFQVCPAGEPLCPETGKQVAAWDSQAHWPSDLASPGSAESLSGEEQGAPSAPGAPKARPATPGLGSRIRAIQESVGKVGAGVGAALLGPRTSLRSGVCCSGQVPALLGPSLPCNGWAGAVGFMWVILEVFD